MIVKFKENGDLYRVLMYGKDVIMKNPETRKWKSAVVYQKFKVLDKNGEYQEPGKDVGDMIFIRDFDDFNDKFETELNFYETKN